MKNNKLYAGILLVVLVVPAVLLGLLVAPWFFLIMVGLCVLPLFFIDRDKK